jgi:oligoendopeptidase F
MSVADVADPEVEEVAWDLSPLLTGDPSDPVAAVDAMLAEAQQRADAFAERHAGRVAELDGAGLAEAMKELGDLQEIVARAGSFSGLHFSTDTTDPERGALFQRVQEKATPIETKLLFFELEWAAIDDERADALLEVRWTRLLPPPPAHRAALPAVPALRARGEDPRREVADRPQRLGPPVRGAGRRAAGDARGRRRAGVARGRARPPALRRPLRARPHGRVGDGRARARPAHARVRVQHAARRQDGRRPAARLQPLAAEPQPLQRGVDESVQALVTAVRNRYELPRRWYRLKAQLLGLDRLTDYDRMAAVTDENPIVAGATRASWCRTPTRPSPPCSATSSTAS